MDINSNQGQAPGAVPSTEKVAEMLSKDISVAMSCLHAIYSDPDLLQSMAAFMRGRQLNHMEEIARKQAQEALKQ